MCCLVAPLAASIIISQTTKKVDEKYHVDWLVAMLWGGSLMLTVEHIAHGEIVFFPPFITAMQSSADTVIMLREIATTGVAMTLAIILVWAIMVFVMNTVHSDIVPKQVAS